ncbi:hypothetical protein BH09BAC6_BH09BAC6_25320 [soil metagenome]
MKIIPYFIILIVIIILSANIFLLVEPVYRKEYFMWVNLGTGVSLLTILLLSILSKKELKKLQQKYIHKIFSKN